MLHDASVSFDDDRTSIVLFCGVCKCFLSHLAQKRKFIACLQQFILVDCPRLAILNPSQAKAGGKPMNNTPYPLPPVGGMQQLRRR
ncbi:MAG: hypothetical protein RSC91_12940, partial [Clostridia bacterium]